MDDRDALRLRKALHAIQSLRSRVEELERGRSQPVAIVGMGARLPGASNLSAFWELLREGQSGIREIPADRWDVDAFYDPDRNAAGKMYVRHGGFLDDVHGFDPAFFGISPAETRRLDPQQRLLLEVTWEALEDAAIVPRQLEGTRTGVYVGISDAEYLHLMQRRAGHVVDTYDLTGTSASVASGRLSYLLGLEGPSLAIDTACSSSLVAVHLAVSSLRSGETDLALAGGVSLILEPDASIAFCRAGALAADGRCKAFDASADGYVRGEGCGVVVLKRLSDALAGGDRIHAVIRGTAVNQDGRTNGLTAPNGRAQQAVIRRALDDAGLEPSDIGYVEAHGSGTALGDPIEANALGAVFAARPAPLLLGAVKTNIGHLEAAAGVAGLLKAVLALQHREIPPNLHFQNPNPHVAWNELPLRVATSMQKWDGARAAGVSSFGFSGTNAHVVIERAPELSSSEAAPSRAEVLTLSAKTEPALRDLARSYAVMLRDTPDLALADVCFTANTGRSTFSHRLALAASTNAEAAERLVSFADGDRRPGLAAAHSTDRPKVAFLFSGQGSQYPGMGKELFAGDPTFRNVILRCDEILRDQGLLDQRLLEVLDPENDANGALIHRTRYAQPALFALEYALAELWRSWGVEPQMLVGHSTGEYVAACVAGVFTLEEALTLIARRAELIERATTDGVTAAVLAPADLIGEVIAPVGADVGISAWNSPRETLIAGTARAVGEARTLLAARGIDSRAVNVAHAPHSPLIEPVLDEFERMAGAVRFQSPRVSVISNVTGSVAATMDASYWRRHMREPVRFVDGIAALETAGCSIMVEVGPQPVLQLLGRQCWKGKPARWLSSLWAIRDDWKMLSEGVADLFVHGVDIDWRAFHRRGARKIALPTYPFQRSRYWFSTPQPPAATAETVAERPPSLRLIDELKARLAVHLETEPAAIGERVSFVELGADSLLVGRLAQDVEELCGVAIGIGRFFDDLDTLDALVAYLERDSGATRPTPRAGGVSRQERTLDPRRQRHLDALVARYGARTGNSRQRTRETRRADTRMLSVRPETQELAYPIIAGRASGARFHDLDGNEYIDLAMGIGALLCGHHPPFIVDALEEQIRRGVQTGPVSDLADEVAAMICDSTRMERMFFSVTGTGAVRGALRLAQAATGRSKFVMFSGSYHGEDDRVLAVPDPDDPLRSLPMAPGVSPLAASDATVLTYGHARSLEVIERRANEIGAVLVEPVQSRNPALQPADFLRDLRLLTSRLHVPLIFDEVITGFRVHPGGAQGWFGVEADLAVYGKCIGGGMPVSIVAGKASYLDRVDRAAERTYLGSTFEMHPLAMASTRAMLRHLAEQGPSLQQRLNDQTAWLAGTLNAFFTDEEVPIRVLWFASMFRFAWKGNASYAHQPLEMEIFHLHLIERGIYLWEGRTCFLSTTHRRTDLDAVIAAVKETVADMRAGGFLSDRTAAPSGVVIVPAAEEQTALWELAKAGENGAPDWCVSENLRLQGRFDLQACRRATQRVVARHESLRTRFGASGRVQEVLPAGDIVVNVDSVDLRGVAENGREEALAAVITRELSRPFDLGAGPLLRILAVQLGDELHHLILIAHHIVCDGWTMTVLVQELAALYSEECGGRAVELETPLQYRDFVLWQQAAGVTEALSKARQFWTSGFAGGVPPLALPLDRTESAEPTLRGARHTMEIGSGLTGAVREAARAHRCTLYTLLLAAHGLLIHRLAASDEIVIGTQVAGRLFKGSDTIVGYCAHFLPIRSVLMPGMAAADYVRTLWKTVREAFEHQAFPFVRLRAAVDRDPRAARFPLRTIFNLDRSIPAPEFQGLEVSFQPVPAAFALADFRLDALELDGRLRIDCDFRTDVLDVGTVQAWCRNYQAILEELVWELRTTDDARLVANEGARR